MNKGTDHLKMPQSRGEYITALMDASEMGATKALEAAGLIKPYLKIREAYRKYGRSIVDRWRKEGLLDYVKDGDKSATFRISRYQIEAVAKSANRSTYLTTLERKL